MAVLGDISGIWAHKFVDGVFENNWRQPLQSTQYASIEPYEAASAPHDQYAWKYVVNTGGAWRDVWRTPAADAKIWFNWHMKQTAKDATADSFYFFYAHPDPDSWGGGPVTGAVRAKIVETSGTTYALYIEQYNGASWVSIGNTGTFTWNTDYYITLGLDKSAAHDPPTTYHTITVWAGDATQMLNGGSPYMATQNAAVAIVNTGTPCIYNKWDGGGKGGGETNDVTVGEVFAYDDDTSGLPYSRVDYYGAPHVSYDVPPHVLSIMAVADSPVAGEDEWGITGNPPGCPNDAWRAVDDYFDDDDQDNDRAHATGQGSNIDQLFDMAEDWHDPGETPTVYGVALVLHSYESGVGRLVNKALLYCTDDSPSTPVEYTLTNAGSTIGAQCATPAHQTPQGNPWSHDKLDRLRAGVRNNSDDSQERCNILLVHILGTHLQQPANNAACPMLRRWPGAVF